MTKHKNPDERRAEILNAAIDELNATGMHGLTMEGIIARTSLSKGGVYRFYRNKREIIQAVLWHASQKLAAIDVQEALSWQLPLVDTVVQKTFRRMLSEENRALLRVLILLTPEIMHDPELQALLRQHDAMLERDYSELLYGIVRRDNLKFRPGARPRIGMIIRMASSLFHGLSVQAMQGVDEASLEEQLVYFIHVSLRDLIEDEDGHGTT